MMTMKELQKACETLAEAWNKALEPMEKFAEALSDAFRRMYASEEENRIVSCRIVITLCIFSVILSCHLYLPIS